MEGNQITLQVILDEFLGLSDRRVDDPDVQECAQSLYNYMNATTFMGTLTKENFQLIGANLVSMSGSCNADPKKLNFMSEAIGYFCSRM